MTIALTIAFVVLFAARILLAWLTQKYEFFEQWLAITTIALIVVSVVLAISLIVYLLEQFVKVRNMFPKGESPQMQATQHRKEKERGETRSDRRERRERRRAEKKALRDKIRRVEAYEKRFWHDRGEN